MKTIMIPRVFLVLLLALFQGEVLLAQDDSGPPKPAPTFIELITVQTSMKKDVWQHQCVWQRILGWVLWVVFLR